MLCAGTLPTRQSISTRTQGEPFERDASIKDDRSREIFKESPRTITGDVHVGIDIYAVKFFRADMPSILVEKNGEEVGFMV